MGRAVEWAARKLISVDYILFTTIDVDTELNYNEVSDARYVSKAELQEMFADKSAFYRSSACRALTYRQLLHPLVPPHRAGPALPLVGRYVCQGASGGLECGEGRGQGPS